MMNKIKLFPGQSVIGFDFGRKRNHIVYCRLCVVPENPSGFEITHWGTHDYPDCTLGAIVTEMHTVMSLLHPSVSGDWFILESQPAGNSRCLAISHAWQALLLANGNPPEQICFTHARTKFNTLDKAGQFRPIINRGVQNGPAKYRQRKKWATSLCANLLESQAPEFRDLFKSLFKKDDYADAFLYAAAFIFKHRPKVAPIHDGDDVLARNVHGHVPAQGATTVAVLDKSPEPVLQGECHHPMLPVRIPAPGDHMDPTLGARAFAGPNLRI